MFRKQLFAVKLNEDRDTDDKTALIMQLSGSQRPAYRQKPRGVVW